MSLQNDAYGRTVVLNNSDSSFDYYLVGGSITYSFATGTPIQNVYVSIAIQWNAVLFQNALRSYVRTLYDPTDMQLPLVIEYLAAMRGGFTARVGYVGQLLDWLNNINDYAATYRSALLAMVNPATIAATVFDARQIPSDPGITLAATASVTSTPRDLMTLTPSTPTRSLNTPFTPSTTNNVMVFYTIRIACTSTILASQTGSVELMSDSSATPTTARSKVSNTLSGVAASNTSEQVISYFVPAGHSVSLVSSGSATISITDQSEVLVTTV